MKKKLFLGLLAAVTVTFTACQKDEVINEVPQDQPIEFGTYVGRDAQTKATITTLSELKQSSEGFGVFAYYTDNTVYNPSTTDIAPNFMYQEQVKWNNSTNKWEYDPIKYWPNNDKKISFFAYAPFTEITNPAPGSNVTGISANDAEGNPTVTFKVASSVDQQVDLLYGYALNQTIAANGPSGTSTEGVKFTFNHALSKIGFKANTTNANENQNKVTINSVTLTGKFTTQATISLYDGSITNPSEPGGTEYTVNFTTDNTATGSTAQALSATQGNIMIIPTDEFNGTSSITISVNYNLQVYDTNINGNYSASVNKTETGTISDINFEQGKAYTIVMTISPSQEITFAVEQIITEWDEDLNDNGNTTDDEKPVTVPNA